MRRIGVGLAALALIGGGIALLIVLLGDDEEGAGGTDSTSLASTEPVAAPSTARATTSVAAAPATTDAATATTAGPDETDPPEETTAAETTEPEADDTEPATDGTAATESSPPGTVVYDLSSEASCEIGQTLNSGDTGPQVVCVQERLNEITVGGEPIPADGVFGEQTEAAVRAFQEANDLTPDGIVGPTTGGALGIWPQ
jgi:hypothetical protein